MNVPTKVKIDRPSGIGADFVPSGFHWLQSFQKDDFITIYYKEDGRIQWLIRHDEDKKSVISYRYDKNSLPSKVDNNNCMMSYFLGEQFKILSREQFFDLFLLKADNHPTSDWILFNVDWLTRLR